MAVDVVQVETRAQLKKFIAFPNRLYKDDPNYVYPLTSERLEFFDEKKNPFYRSAKTRLFLAMRDGQVVGRIDEVKSAADIVQDTMAGFYNTVAHLCTTYAG